jgi:hypothetical protein
VLPKANHFQWEATIGSNAEMATSKRFLPEYFTTIEQWARETDSWLRGVSLGLGAVSPSRRQALGVSCSALQQHAASEDRPRSG